MFLRSSDSPLSVHQLSFGMKATHQQSVGPCFLQKSHVLVCGPSGDGVTYCSPAENKAASAGYLHIAIKNRDWAE
jgi:hypothetical protein